MKPKIHEYIFTVRVKDDGIGDPNDDAVANEYVSVVDIRDELEKCETAGLTFEVERIQSSVKRVLTDIPVPYKSKRAR